MREQTQSSRLTALPLWRLLVAMLVNRGSSLVTSDAEGNIHIWARGASKPSREIKAHKNSVTALAAIPGAEGEFLSGSADGFVRRWNAQSGVQVREFDNGAAIVALAVRPDGRRIAAAGPDFVKLWPDDSTKAIALPERRRPECTI